MPTTSEYSIAQNARSLTQFDSPQLTHGAGNASSRIHSPPLHIAILQKLHSSVHGGPQNWPSCVQGVPMVGVALGQDRSASALPSATASTNPSRDPSTEASDAAR